MSGFTTRHIKYTRAFALAWPDVEFRQRTVAQIPWRIVYKKNVSVIKKYTLFRTVSDFIKHETQNMKCKCN